MALPGDTSRWDTGSHPPLAHSRQVFRLPQRDDAVHLRGAWDLPTALGIDETYAGVELLPTRVRPRA